MQIGKTTPEHRGHESARVATGIPGLDTVLHGGLLSGSTYMFVGPPGTGKTILSNQFAFQLARQNKQVVYITLLGETHSRMISNLRHFDFFDDSEVGSRIHYISAYQVVSERGLEALRLLLHQMVQSKGAALLVIDGMSSIEPFAQSALAEAPKFFHALQFLTELTGCTTVFLFNPSSASNAYSSLVDGIVEMNTESTPSAERRRLQVRKLRGSPKLVGDHSYIINEHGITVFPRLETLPLTPSVIPEKPEVLGFDLPAFDRMLGGGIERASSTILMGPPGSGKTGFCLAFLEAGAARGEPGLFYGFSEPPDWFLSTCDPKAAHYVKSGLLKIRWQQPYSLLLDQFAHELLESAAKGDYRRLVIDGMGGMFFNTPEQRRESFLPLFFSELRARGVTPIVSLVALDGRPAEVQVPLLSQHVDNLIALQYVRRTREMVRQAAVFKIRCGEAESRCLRFRFSPSGLAFDDDRQRGE